MHEISTGVIWNITFAKKEEIQISYENTQSKPYSIFQAKIVDKNIPLKFTFNNKFWRIHHLLI